jgi:hypothetical protein
MLLTEKLLLSHSSVRPMLFRYIYVAFIGIFIANVVAVGVITFFPAPEQPETPDSPGYSIPADESPDYPEPTNSLLSPSPVVRQATDTAKMSITVSPTPDPKVIATWREKQNQEAKEFNRKLRKHQQDLQKYKSDQEIYETNSVKHMEYTFLLYVGLAVFLALLSLVLLKKLQFISESLMVGGLYLLYYYVDPLGVTENGAPAEFTPLGVGILIIGFLVTLVAGYFIFSRAQKQQIAIQTPGNKPQPGTRSETKRQAPRV